MKVTEICGYVDSSDLYPKYIADYYTKIEGRNVIVRRTIGPDISIRGPYVWERLNDSIDIHDLR